MPSSKVPLWLTRGSPWLRTESMWKCASTNGGDSSQPWASRRCAPSGLGRRGPISTKRPSTDSRSMPLRPSGSVAFSISSADIAAASFGAEDAVAGVAEPRHDIAVVIELVVDRRGVNRHLGMMGVKVLDALWRCQQADEADRARPCLLQAIDGGHRRVAGGQHRVEHDGVAFVHAVWHLEVVLHRHQRLGVAVQPNVADPRAGNHLEHAVEEAG